jgi:hypothetical protein
VRPPPSQPRPSRSRASTMLQKRRNIFTDAASARTATAVCAC